MNKFRPYVLAASVLCAALLAFGFLTQPGPKSADHEGFSSARVMEDIEVIAKNPHSVAHPQERAALRDYLAGRLEELGGKVTFFQYDSLGGPGNKHVSYYVDGVNILAEFPPVTASADTTYMMFLAHYDARYPGVNARKETINSHGAADDGYGLGVTLEALRNLLKSRNEWKQGVKVLFTDAEEIGMLGMESAWADDRHIFDNVGFVINMEARGTWGPALLFETSPGNEKVMDLYASAKSKHTYSLTTVVYKFMPNYTDFTIVKDDIPGMNFSTVADINHYHTEKDCIDNVSERSIQHYGAQILPVAEKYLLDPVYSDKDYLKSDMDTTNFTIPVLGLFNFSKGIYLTINAAIFFLFLMLFAMEGVRGRLKAMRVFKTSCAVLCIAVGILALGELVAYLSALIAGVRFKPFGVMQGIRFDNALMLVLLIVQTIIAVLLYMSMRRSAVRQTSGSMRASAASNAVMAHALDILYGTLALLFTLSIILVFALGENLMFFAPLAFATIALILWRLTSMRVWLLAAVVMILLHAFSFLFVLSMALTIGAYGAVAMLAFLDFMVIVPLADMYLMPVRSGK